MMRNKQLNQVKGAKTHYKMYKSGKLWLFAGMTAVTLGALGFNNTSVHADTNNKDGNDANHSSSLGASDDTKAAVPETTKAIDVTSATSSVASDANVSEQGAAQSATSSSTSTNVSVTSTDATATQSSVVTSSNVTQASDTSQQSSAVTVATGISLRDLNGNSNGNTNSFTSSQAASIIAKYNKNRSAEWSPQSMASISSNMSAWSSLISDYSSTLNSREVKYTQVNMFYNSLESSASYLYSAGMNPINPNSSIDSVTMSNRAYNYQYWLELVNGASGTSYPDSINSSAAVSAVASLYLNGTLQSMTNVGGGHIMNMPNPFDNNLSNALTSMAPTISNVVSYYDSQQASMNSATRMNNQNPAINNLVPYINYTINDWNGFNSILYNLGSTSPLQLYNSLTSNYIMVSSAYSFESSVNARFSNSIASSDSLSYDSLSAIASVTPHSWLYDDQSDAIYEYGGTLSALSSTDASNGVIAYYDSEQAFANLLTSQQAFLGSLFDEVTANSSAIPSVGSSSDPKVLNYKVYSNVSSAGVPLTSSQTAFMGTIDSMTSAYSSMGTNLDQNNNFSGSNVIAQQANSLANLVSSATSSVSLLSNALTTTLNSLKSNSNYATLIKDLISQYHVKDFAGLTSAINSQYYSNLNNLTSKFASAPNDVNDSLTPFYQNYTNNGDLLNDANNDTSNFGSDAISFTLNQGSFDTLLNQFVSNAPTSLTNLQSSYNAAYSNASQFNNDLNNAISNADALNSLHGDINSLSSALSIANSNYNKESSAYNSLSSSESTIISSQANNLKSLESNINSLTSAKNSVVSDYQKQSSEYNSLIATNKSLSDDVKNDQQLNDSLMADLKSVTALKDTESNNYNNLSVAYDNLKKSNTATITSLTQALSNEDNTNSQESSLANALQSKLSQAVNDQSVANKNFASETSAYKSLDSSATSTISSLENELKSADAISSSLSNAAKSQSDVINNDNKSLASLNSKNATNSSQNDSLNNVIKSQSNTINSDNNSLASLSNKSNDFNSLAQHLHDDDSVIASLLSHNAKLLSSSNDVKSSSSNNSFSSSNLNSSSSVNNTDFAGGFSDSTSDTTDTTTPANKTSDSNTAVVDEAFVTLNTPKYLGLNDKANKIVEPKSQYKVEKSLFELSNTNKSDYVGKTVKLTKFAYLHSKFDFKHDNHKRLVRPHKTFKIKDIVVKNGITRLLINKHQYLTGNTKFVKLINNN